MAFVTMGKEQFERSLPQGFTEINGERAWEIIYEIPTPKNGVGVRIYSTVDKRTGVTRGRGEDAIRIVYWDIPNDRPLGKGKKILRVEGKTTIESRIQDRISEFLAGSHNVSSIDYGYIRSILNHDSVAWMVFAQSLLESIETYGTLTENQLKYVLGETNPKGKATFEARVLNTDGSFTKNYMENNVESEDSHENDNQERKETTESSEEQKVIPISASNKRTLQDQLDKLKPKPRKLKKIQISVVGPPINKPCLERVETSQYPYHTYPFTHFNPVQSMVLPYQKTDCNLVIGANTSAGKTICAEFLMDHVLSQGKRVIYMSPLKSLTQEKYIDWEKRFPNEKITILTGDYVLNNDMKNQLAESRIIVMTSEMVDSRTRRMRAEKNYWLMEVGLLIVDESHIITTSRGHAVESGIMRFTKINPNARILLLSATMPNCNELADWLTVLNGKVSQVIFSSWRPVTLVMSYLEYRVGYFPHSGRQDYWGSQENKKELAIRTVLSKPDEKFLVFVHDKGTGRDLVKRFEENGVRALFHNADLDLEERLEVEKDFANRAGGLRVLISTSTLAWGRNLPARNVVIVGVHRGITEVDPLDIIQMAGRAGRYGIDDAGFVFLIIPETETATWTYNFDNPRPVQSILKDKHIMAFHALAEIDNSEIKDATDLHSWYSRSLAFKQNIEFTETDSKDLVIDLENMEMVIKRENSNLINSTKLGKVSSWLYFSPYDVSAWHTNVRKIVNSEIELNDITLSWAIGNIPSNDWGYVPKDLVTMCNVYSRALFSKSNGLLRVGTSVPFCVAVMECLRGAELKNSPVGPISRNIQYDTQRVSQALALIDSMYTQWGLDAVWKSLPLRIKYGVPEEMVQLVRLPGIGKIKAKKLWDAGMHSLEDMASFKGKTTLAELFQPTMAIRLQRKAKQLMGLDPDLELTDVEGDDSGNPSVVK